MLSITIFATIVGEMLPVSDSTPLIGLIFFKISPFSNTAQNAFFSS